MDKALGDISLKQRNFMKSFNDDSADTETETEGDSTLNRKYFSSYLET